MIVKLWKMSSEEVYLVCSRKKWCRSNEWYGHYFDAALALRNYHIALNHLRADEDAVYNTVYTCSNSIGVGARTKRAATETEYCNTRRRRFSVFSDDLSAQKPDLNDNDEQPVGESDLDYGTINDGARVLHPDSDA